MSLKAENTKLAFHPRNQHRVRYDFDALIQACPSLAKHVKPNKHGDQSVDFSNPLAVKTLNQALLKQYYNVDVWDIPRDYLCPPIPGRADYLHYLADLLSKSNDDVIPKGQAVRVLDIGVGANAIYPLIGQYEYGWQFVGVDIDEVAINHAQKMITANALEDVIQLRLQKDAASIFKGVIKPGERFNLTMCNPPFHRSLSEAQAGTHRKWRGLGQQSGKQSSQHARHKKSVVRNFGGQSNELFCEGGEAAFISTMINESRQFAEECQWFTTLVSKATTLPLIYRALNNIGATNVETIQMKHGQKQTRIVAWQYI